MSPEPQAELTAQTTDDDESDALTDDLFAALDETSDEDTDAMGRQARMRSCQLRLNARLMAYPIRHI